MNPIDQTFGNLKAKGETALIPFITVGDPDPETTLDIIRELEIAGADMLELGVPYSDPLADGPVIQQASLRALANDVNIVDCIHLAGRARKMGIQLPFILFTYFNPVLQTGLHSFFDLVQANGISGLIIPDLPHEESGEIRAMAAERNIHLIPLVAPTSKERIREIVKTATGFVYCVSSLGVTGMRNQFHEGIEEFIQAVKQSTDLPAAIGFGISKHEHVLRFSGLCEGVVVGSAIVRQIGEVGPLLGNADTKAKGLSQIRQFVAGLKG